VKASPGNSSLISITLQIYSSNEISDFMNDDRSFDKHVCKQLQNVQVIKDKIVIGRRRSN